MNQGDDIILIGHVSHWAFDAPDIIMGAAARLGDGAPADKDFFVAGDAREGANQHVGQFNYVRHQVVQGNPALLLLKAPGEESVGVITIVIEKTTELVG